jgi:hypothetical protein
MKNKKEFIDRLRDDSFYKHALSKAKDENERKAISTFVEGFVGDLADILTPIISQAESDPSFIDKFKRALEGNEDVLSVTESVSQSGSIG